MGMQLGMQRKNEPEILDRGGTPEELVHQAYCQLAGIHRWLGDTRCVIRALRSDPLPVRRVLDVGCATGSVLEEVKRQLRVEAIGVDVNPRTSARTSFPILRADAARDPLPPVDVAYSMHVGHHLPENDVIELIRNVGRFCRRFVFLDLVRHPLPLALFGCFVVPFVSSLTAEDGKKSIRRSYTPTELNRLATTALAGSRATFRHTIAPLYIRQVVDICYGPVGV
jgi:SAM-dependent methyltransferase